MELSMDHRHERRGAEASALSETGGHETESEYFEDEEDELRKAGRMGILLLEKNHELQHENTALRSQVKALESERPGMQDELLKQENELEILREERKQSLMEVTRLQGELRSKSLIVTSSLDREQRIKEAKEAADALLCQAEDKLSRLQTEFKELLVKNATDQPQAIMKDAVVVANPAATYDSNQNSTFTLQEHEELLQQRSRLTDENETWNLELRSLRKELDAMRRQASKTGELKLLVERLEKKSLKQQHVHDSLQEELTEARSITESQQTMMMLYKKIADARPFSTECTCVLHSDGDGRDGLGVSLQEQLLDTNMRLDKELRELRARLSAGNDDTSASENVPNNNSSHTSNVDEGDGELAVEEMEAETETSAPIETADASVNYLIQKIQDMEEKNTALKESLRHATQQWQAAIASQKALDECRQTLEAELMRMRQAVDHRVSGLAHGHATSNNTPENNNSPEANDQTHGDRHSEPKRDYADGEDGSEKWVEETAPYPAPPGDLNSPLIKCLLDHWTTEKSKIMHLTDWLHHAIRGTGKPRPLRLEHLTSEVAAGFTQLLVPILRERHGVSVSIYRRESIQILTDMVFQAHQPSHEPEAQGLFSTLAAKLSEALTSSSGSTATDAVEPPGQSRMDRRTSSGSVASSESGSYSTVGGDTSTARARRRRHENLMPMDEAHFLYG